jgi:hypothetical protein
MRRRPVPRDWRADRRRLTVTTTRWGGSNIAGRGLTFRSRGCCSCGAKWPESIYAPSDAELSESSFSLTGAQPCARLKRTNAVC